MKRPTKDSGVPWLGDVPAEWTIDKIKYWFAATNTRGNSVLQLLAATQKYGMYPQERLEGVVQVAEKTDLNTFKTVHVDDFVISLRSFQGGLERSDFEGVCSPAYQTFHATKEIDTGFFKHLFKSSGFIQAINLLTVGIREGKSINYSDVRNLCIPIPPLPEQRRIAVFLDCAVAKIDGIRAGIQREIERLDDYRKSLVAETVCRGVRGTNRALKPSGIPWLGDMPAEWEKVRVGRILTEINRRSEVGTEEPLSMSQKYGIVPSKMIDVANPASSFVGAKMVSPGDIVLNKLKAHLGVFAISKYEGLVSPDYAVYRANEGVSAEYFNYVFHSPRCISEFRRRITGVAVGFNRLYTSDLFKIDVPLPSLPEQREIVAYLDKATAQIDAAVEARKGQLEKLDILKKTTIAEFTTGKKEVLA